MFLVISLATGLEEFFFFSFKEKSVRILSCHLGIVPDMVKCCAC